MATTSKTKLLIWVLALALIMACVPTLAAPGVPTTDPGAINTFIAQTVEAASRQTQAAIPTSTSTPTATPTVVTETPSPTPTATIIFILPTSTPVFTLTAVSSGGNGDDDDDDEISSENYSCQVVRVSPANGTVMDPREDFDAVWTVRNNGQRNWDRTSIDHVYDRGDRIHKVSGYDLRENVRVGNSIDLGVDMRAPKDPGTYTTTWILRVGNREFCPMSLTIVVR